MKVLVSSLAAFLVIMSIMFSIVMVVIQSRYFAGFWGGSIGVGILLMHLYWTDLPKLSYYEE